MSKSGIFYRIFRKSLKIFLAAQIESVCNLRFLAPKILVRTDPEWTPNRSIPNGPRTEPERILNGARELVIFGASNPETALGIQMGIHSCI